MTSMHVGICAVLDICVSTSLNFLIHYNHYILNFNLFKYFKGIVTLYQIDILTES